MTKFGNKLKDSSSSSDNDSSEDDLLHILKNVKLGDPMPGVKIVEENNLDEAERKRKWI